MYMILVIVLLLMPLPIYIGFQSLFKDKYQHKIDLALKEAFRRVTKRHRLFMFKVTVFKDRLIGIDKRLNRLIIINYKHGITAEKCFTLDDLINCRVVNRVQSERGCITNIAIELTLSSDPAIVRFSFFDEKTDDSRNFAWAVKKSKIWESIIKDRATRLSRAIEDLRGQ